MNVTQHFTLEELTFSETAKRRGWDNTPPIGFQENLSRVAIVLEEVRALFDLPLKITSGYRSKNVNDAVGSKNTSQHMTGCAADFQVPQKSIDEVMEAIYKSAIQYDQLIKEFDSWIHISVPKTIYTKPRLDALVIDRKGTRPYLT
jgi:hypothetical protein